MTTSNFFQVFLFHFSKPCFSRAKKKMVGMIPSILGYDALLEGYHKTSILHGQKSVSPLCRI